MVFSVVMYRCEIWTVKKAECQRIDAFELWFWRRLESPLETWRSNQSILKEINQEYFQAPQFESINSLALSLLYGPNLTSVHDYWKDCGSDYMDLGRQSDAFAF